MSMPNKNLSNQLFNRVGFTSLAAAAVILPACGSPTPEAEMTESGDDMAMTDETMAVESNVTTEDLSENLDAYLGQTVSVREEVEELVGDYAFMLDDDQLFGGEEILIINASGQPVNLVEGDDTDVQVTGEVRELILADLEQDYGFDLDDELFVDYEDQPVIVAQSIALAPDPGDITDNPENYYYQRLAVNGDVGMVVSENTVTLESEELFGGEDLLAISPEDTISLNEDEEVVMTGVLRPFITSEIEQEYDLTWDLDLQEKLEAEYQDRPILIVDSVYPSAL
jgi:hemin uptake protein HemP